MTSARIKINEIRFLVCVVLPVLLERGRGSDQSFDPAIAIDMPIWEHPEDVIDSSLVSETAAGFQQQDGGHYYHYQQHHQHYQQDDRSHDHDAQAAPLIDVDQAVVLIDGVREDEEEEDDDERSPLLGGNECDGVAGLSLPLNMSRRASSHIGLLMENGETHQSMETTVANFLRSKSDSCHLASTLTTSSPGDTDRLLDGAETMMTTDPELRDVANHFVTEILTRAQLEASKKLPTTTDKVVLDADKLKSDERLMEVVRRFVSDIMTKAKAEAWDSMRQIQTNNNNVLTVKVGSPFLYARNQS
nr:uncharacterized protein LOC128703523 [Cherax quadricarinatus]